MNAEIRERIEIINRGEVPEGYKNTSVGIIPEDWEVKRLGETRNMEDKYSFTGGPFGSDLKKEHYTNNGIRILQLQNIGDGIFINDYKIYTSNKKADELYGCNIFPGEILIAKMADPLARACIVPNNEDRYLLASDGIRLKVDSNKYVTKYIMEYINSNYFRNKAIKKGTGTTRLRIGLGELARIKLATPKISEQNKIAQILSTWDKAIELKEKLIKEKQEQKKGLMQKLLTGEVRLPGFDGEWEEVRLGEVLKERKETSYETLELLAITASKGIVKRDEIDIKDTSSNDKSNYKRIIPLDIGYNTMRMWQGVSGVSEYEGIVSPAYTILKPTPKVDSYFMGYLFKLPQTINLFKRFSQGLVNDTLNLKYINFKVIKMRIPKGLQEQKAIAQILSTADKEIDLLNGELEQLKLQKKGLMQLLLTGIVRVQS